MKNLRKVKEIMIAVALSGRHELTLSLVVRTFQAARDEVVVCCESTDFAHFPPPPYSSYFSVRPPHRC